MSGVLGGIFNAFVDTVFSQNVGAVATTRVYSRYVTATSGAILIVLGLIPRMGEVVAALPDPVVGGVGIILFSTVAVVGINTLRKVDLSDPINTTIAAVSVGIGILPEFAEGMFERFPSSAQILLGSGITLAAASAFSLNLLFNHTRLGELARRSRESSMPLQNLNPPPALQETPVSQSQSDPFEVPVVDISPYVLGGADQDKARVAAEVDHACRTVGFMQIRGHGVPAAVSSGLAEAMDDFFGLPMEAKSGYRIEGANRGYSPPKSESLSLSLGVESATRMNDFFEAFNVGTEARSFTELELSEDDYGINLWPAVSGFTERVENYYAHGERVARTLTAIFEDALGLTPGFFESITDHSIDVLRMNNYALPEDGDVGR